MNVKFRQKWLTRLACVAFILQVLPTNAGTVLYTTNDWTGDAVAALGGNGVTAYGQTFTVPSDSVLQSFSLFVGGFDTTLPVEFRAYVAAWNNNRASFDPTLPVLFTSPVMTSTAGSSDWQEVTVNTGNLSLTPGGQYVFFFGTYGLFQGIQYQLKMEYIDSSSAYSGGEFVFDAQGAATATLSQAFANSWTVVTGTSAGSDAAFIADFVPVPEPTPLVLFLTLSLVLVFLLKLNLHPSAKP